MNSFILNVQNSIKTHWDLPSLTDYKSSPIYYHQLAQQIEKLHIFYKECGIKKGDKIALCGRNSSSWAITFFSVLTYGAVAVPLLHEFKADTVQHLVNHSDAKLLFVGDVIWESLEDMKMPSLEGVIMMQDFSLVASHNDKCKRAFETKESIFEEKYKGNFNKDCLNYHKDSPNELALINYTSGTTSLSKGVMLPYRALLSNLLFAQEVLPNLQSGMNVVSMLPMAHMYGLAFEIIYEFVQGIHIHFLTRVPSPKIIAEAFSRIKPDLIIAVPLIIEKIYKSKLKPILEKPFVKLMLKTPFIDRRILAKINDSLNDAFGGRFYEVIIGGAAMNHEIEDFFKRVGFRYTVGYGMTECAPIITYQDYSQHIKHSCGKVAPRMKIKINSPDSENIPGEILVKGDNVMLGYYKNPEATMAALDKDGWLHTGDLGIVDKEGNLFIKGRSKNMILGASGQNIYPEEIEDKLNSMEYVSESLVMEQEGKIVALVYLDHDKLDHDHIDVVRSKSIIKQIREKANSELPAYSQIAYLYIQEEEFEKTPKKSIKRYLYTSINKKIDENS